MPSLSLVQPALPMAAVPEANHWTMVLTGLLLLSTLARRCLLNKTG